MQKKFDCRLYILVQLFVRKCEDGDILLLLGEIGKLHQVTNMLKLLDESWEIVVLKSYLLELEDRFDKTFPSCYVNLNYDYTKPSKEDIDPFNVAAKPPNITVYHCTAKDCYSKTFIFSKDWR